MTRRLADVGTTGHQLDVADGGDVDPATGRLLTIAEMQAALRTLRRAPIQDSPREFRLEPEERSLASDEDDYSNLLQDDPYDWPSFDSSNENAPKEAPAPTSLLEGEVRRGDRQHVAVADRESDVAAPMAKRSWGVRVLRRAVGMDSAKSATHTSSRRRRSTRRRDDTDQWLPVDEPSGDPLPAAESGSTEPLKDTPATGKQQAGRGRRRQTPAAPDSDFEVGKARRGFVAVFWRWAARLLVVLMVVAGFNQLFIRPWKAGTVDAELSVSRGVDIGAAEQLAGRFTADYLSYVSTAPTTGADALGSSLAPAANVTSILPTGSGYLRADVVQPGQATVVDDAHVVVSVAARVRVGAAPAAGVTSGPTAAPAAAAADPGPVPIGWTDLGSRWITVVVPVESTAVGLRVSASGPVFSAEPAAMVRVPAGDQQAPPTMIAASADVAKAFFTGYAASQVSYLATPGTQMRGLNATVSVSSVDAWTLSVPTSSALDTTGSGTASDSDPHVGVGTGTVAWQVTGTGVLIRQRYTVDMTHADGRWYASALSPVAADD